MQFLPFQNEDYDTMYEFMRPLWLETYSKILPKEQIFFLLDKYFSKDGIAHYRAWVSVSKNRRLRNMQTQV